MKKENLAKKNMPYLMKIVWDDQKNLYAYYLLYVIFTLAVSLAVILTPRYLIAELAGGRRKEAVIAIALGYLVITGGCGVLLSFIKNRYDMSIARARYHLLERTKEKIQRVDYRNLEDPKRLDEFWRVVTAVDDSELGFQGIVVEMFTLLGSGVSSLFYLWILSSLNIWVVLLIVADIFLVFWLRSRAGRYSVEGSGKKSPHNRRERYLVEIMGNFAYGKDIRIFGLSNMILKKLKDNGKPRHDIDVEIQRHQLWADFAESIFACIRDGVIYGYLIYSVFQGRISIADFTMCFMAVAALTLALEQVLETVAYVGSELFRIDELRKFLALPNEEAVSSGTTPVPVCDRYEIEFKHMTFRYPGADRDVYTDFNFTIEAGQKLAVVGINGAGKTTLVKLITRLYQPTQGQILLNGIDIQEFSLYEYRKLLTVVLQDVNLFAMSLKDNIVCTDGSAGMGQPFDETRFRSSIQQAGLEGFFVKHGSDPDLPLTKYLEENGVDVSGGERQKIGIARALYRDGRIMIFDEPTAALDAQAEYALYHQLGEISKGRTLLFISHRLASTRFCDKIALIDGGQAVEVGTHEELMEKRGMYFDMFQTQKKYYEEGGSADEEQL